VDLLEAIRSAEALAHAGNRSAAADEYRRIASDYPEAVWARGMPVVAQPKLAKSPPGKTFALLIGISRYPKESPLPNLMYADADAKTFSTLLQTPRGGDIPSSQIKLLLNNEATRDGIDSAVRTFVNQAAGAQNTLILFVAAHGHFLTINKDPKTQKIVRDPYILTADVYRQDVKTTGYPMAELRNLIAEQTFRFGKVLVYLDVCHAGYVRDAASEPGLQPAVKRVFSDREGNVGVMMAAEANSFAYEAAEFGKHGAFTYYVLDGLNGGAAHRNDPVITFADLFRHVVNGVGDLTNNTQSPDKFVNNDRMAVLDDVTKNPGILLPKATPLPENATRRHRGAAPVLQVSDQGAEAPPSSEFELLARRDPLAAIPEYASLVADPNVPEETKQQSAEILRVALEEHGQQILIQYMHGEQIPQKKTEFELCGRYFEEALRLPMATTFDESRMWFCKGRALIFDREDAHHQEAVRLLERSILLDPDHAYAYNALGIAYLEQVRTHPDYYQRSISAFHDALRFAPEWAYPMHNLALTHAEQGNFALAEDSYRQAMRLAPAYSYLPYNLALLNQRMNRLEDAENLYRIAMREAEEARGSGLVPPVSPWRERANILNALGTVAAAKRRYQAAQDYYGQALQDDPQLTGAKYNLAALLSRRGPSQQAVQLWRENVAAEPASPASRLALAEYLAKYGDRSEAIREYEAAVQVAPNHTAARRELAKLYARDNRWQGAYDQLMEARKQIPDQAGIAEEYGDAAVKLGRLAEGAAAYRDAARLYTVKRDRKRIEAKLSSLGKL
jgi:tetratricopeptide (TPR) repeat protein